MNDIISSVNQFVICSVVYSLLFIFYGYLLYHIGNFIVGLFAAAYRRVKADWKAWYRNKDDQ